MPGRVFYPGVADIDANGDGQEPCAATSDIPDGNPLWGWVGDRAKPVLHLVENASDRGAAETSKTCGGQPLGFQEHDHPLFTTAAWAYCMECPYNLTKCTSPSLPPPASPPPPSPPPSPPPPSPPEPSPPPFPPPPETPTLLEPVWQLPRDQCGWSGLSRFEEKYPYTTGAAALQGCLDFGCTGLANASFLNSSAHRYAVDAVDKPTLESERCYAAWYIDDVENVSSPTYFIRETPRQACGNELGYLQNWNEGRWAAGCVGCPHIHTCPFPPPSPPPPSPPPPTPPPFPPRPPHAPPTSPPDVSPPSTPPSPPHSPPWEQPMVPPSPPPPNPPPPSPSPPPPHSPVADADSGVGTGGGGNGDGDFLPIFILVVAVLIGIACCVGCCCLARPAAAYECDRRTREDFDNQQEYERWLEECDEDELRHTLRPARPITASASAQAKLVEAIEKSTTKAKVAHLEKQGLLSLAAM